MQEGLGDIVEARKSLEGQGEKNGFMHPAMTTKRGGANSVRFRQQAGWKGHGSYLHPKPLRSLF